ncbi:hypothetical protein U1Q18_003447 [Sarracenia purpurea var. burkii]
MGVKIGKARKIQEDLVKLVKLEELKEAEKKVVLADLSVGEQLLESVGGKIDGSVEFLAEGVGLGWYVDELVGSLELIAAKIVEEVD